ncbi:Extracellular Matrix protein PelA [hydrothermal vent metagenome]|uniref:Extracellular Matrix protein PelA n=1 Tax=hydrothermal vent metagenome TaxID=652676 RepID=A0A1W1BY01_9ZZZZ
MKHLCCNKIVFILLLFVGILQASLYDKSAIMYLGNKISYPMIGIHDYIIVDPDKTNIYTHGFAVYNDKIYARVVLDNTLATDQLLENVKRLYKKGFHNFFIDPAAVQNSGTIVAFLNKISVDALLQKSKIILHPTQQLPLQNVANTFHALLIYNAQEQKNLREYVTRLQKYTKNIIDIETIDSGTQTPAQRISFLKNKGLIPYITNADMDIYGNGVKNAVKREILTIIDDSVDDRIVLSAHQYGALPLEYQGYIQTLYDIKQGLPDPDHMSQYAGVVVWLNTEYKFPEKLTAWVNALQKKHIYVAFADNFGFNIDEMPLLQLGIKVTDGKEGVSKTIVTLDPMMNYEIKAQLSKETLYFKPPQGSKALFKYKDTDGETSTPAAITPWGGYAISDSFMIEIDKENIWVINPFEYFKEALRLKPIPVPDPTTENGSRLFFTHVDGDGYVSRAEFDPEKLAGEVIYKEILRKYKIPHSISVIGAEVMPNGLYPELSKRCLTTIKKMYALDNVEPATHTFTHTFFWGKIDKNGNLKPEYRLKPKGYKYSLSYEIKGMLDFINDNLLEKNATKKARTVFWSGDCSPRENALSLVYKNKILNINGGDTTINNSEPWLSLVAPLGIARGEYYQIYTGEQNENVFTNDWLGPFWGFKKVVQTFKLTDKPKRLKPIDVYYHLYSGSKKASLNAVRYVFDWVLKQPNIMPIFTSDYIPKVMDYYTVSIAHKGDNWLVSGMHDLKTLRLETQKQHIDYKKSLTVLGEKTINNRTYVALDTHQEHILKLQNNQEDTNYLVSANGKLSEVIKGNTTTRYIFRSEVALTLKYHLKKGCTFQTTPLSKLIKKKDSIYIFQFPKKIHKGILDVRCR